MTDTTTPQVADILAFLGQVVPHLRPAFGAVAPYAPPGELRQFAGILRDCAVELGGVADIAEGLADKREEWKSGGLVQREAMPIPPKGPTKMSIADDDPLEIAARYVRNTYGNLTEEDVKRLAIGGEQAP